MSKPGRPILGLPGVLFMKNDNGVCEFEHGWYAYTKRTLIGNFKTKEEAEMALLEMMLE